MDRFEPLKELIDRLYDSRRFHDRQSFEDKTLDLAAGLDAETERRVRAYVVQRAAELPVALTTTKEAQEAEDICRQAAEQLVTADWFNRVLVTWPAPIAHEVQQLTVVLNGDHRAPSPEAALLQLRDVTDTLIKLPAIIFARTLIERGGEDARFARVKMLHQCLLTGVWMDAARELAKRVAKEPQSVAKLANLFVPSHTFATALSALITARNDYLGHAALRANPAETAGIVAWYAAGLQTKTVQLRNTTTLAEGLGAAVRDDPWLGLRLEAEDGDTFIDLTGAQAVTAWDQTRRHKHDERTLPIRLVMSEEYALELAPYVAARVCEQCKGRDVFLFDTVKDLKKTKVDFQEYAHGHKARLDQHTAPDMGRELIALPLAGPILLADDTSHDLESGSTIARLDRARVEHAYFSPGYLREGLARFINETDRGVYWLRAPAHVGKTTFVQGLVLPILGERELAHRLAPGPGGGVAEYFCKKEYREGSISFLNGLAAALQNALDIRDDASVPKPEPRQVLEAVDKRRALVSWVDRWRALARRAGRPLLIIIDGLDEADDPAKADSLLHLLPRPDELSAGLYLLLTSRRIADSDCPIWLGPTIEPLYASGDHVTIREIGLDDADYVALLCAYAARALGRRSGEFGFEALFSSILKQSGGRFVYVTFLVEQLRAGRVRPEELPALGNGDEIYGRFLDRLDERYGEKRADDIRMVLATIVAEELAHEWMFGPGSQPDHVMGGNLEPTDRIWHGTSLDLLAEATGLDVSSTSAPGMRHYDARLIETLLLVHGVLGVSRGRPGAARYRLGLKGLGHILAQHREIGPLVARAHMHLASLTLDSVDTMQAIKGGTAGPIQATDLNLFRESAVRLAGHVALASSAPLRQRFRIAPLIEPTQICCRADEQRAAYADVIRWSSLEAFWLETRYREPRSPGLELDLNHAYMDRGYARYNLADLLGALKDYDWAIPRQREVLRNTRTASYEVDRLASAYMQRGNARRDLGNLNGAIEDCQSAISTWEHLKRLVKDRWTPADEMNLANGFVNRGNVQLILDDYGGAYDAYDHAIAILVKLRSQIGEARDINFEDYLANALMNRGNALKRLRDIPRALKDYDQAIALRERLRGQFADAAMPELENRRASVYVNRGNARSSVNNLQGACDDFTQAITIREILKVQMADAFTPGHENSLANAYMNRGAARGNLADVHGAVEDYNKAVDYREALKVRLGKNWTCALEFDLAKSHMNRAIGWAMEPNGSYDANAFDHTIELLQVLKAQLGNSWLPEYERFLVCGYMNRAHLQDRLGNQSDAAKNYDCAIASLEALKASRTGPDVSIVGGKIVLPGDELEELLSRARRERASVMK
jgi:tetratricopeptide (TPR) repeat protein